MQIDAREGQTMSGDGAQPITTEQLLTETEVRALLAAARTVDEREGWGGDLYRMVLVLAATGARYSQACRLTVRDLQPDPCLHVPGSRKGRNADPTQREPVPITPSAYEMLAAATVGRPKRDPLLERWRHVQTEGAVGVWRRDRRGAWAPAELNRPWQLITDEAGIVRDDGRVPTPYWFRHSRIVTMLRAGIPMAVTAKATTRAKHHRPALWQVPSKSISGPPRRRRPFRRLTHGLCGGRVPFIAICGGPILNSRFHEGARGGLALPLGLPLLCNSPSPPPQGLHMQAHVIQNAQPVRGTVRRQCAALELAAMVEL